jgi:hypothetical protein
MRPLARRESHRSIRARRWTLLAWVAYLAAVIHVAMAAVESDTQVAVQNPIGLTEPGRPHVVSRLPSSLVLKWVPPRRQSGALVKRIEVSMLQVDDPNAIWVDAGPQTHNSVGIISRAQPQVQTLTSRADLGQTVSDGTFR